MAEYSIGALAKAAGTKVQTIRWYEQQGLMPRPARTAGGQRRYGEAEMRRLKFIRHGRELGFSLDDIRALLELADDPSAPCEAANALAERQLEEVRSRIARLRELEKELERMLRECPSGEVRSCRVIEVLSDHALCLHERH